MQEDGRGMHCIKECKFHKQMRRKMLKMLKKFLCMCPDRDLNACFTSQLLTYSDPFHIFCLDSHSLDSFKFLF